MSKQTNKALELAAEAGKMVRAGRLDQAESLLKRVIKLLPTDAAQWSNLGTVQGMAGRLDESERSFRRASQLAPDRLEVWYNLARTQMARGEAAAGEASAQKAVTVAPDSPDAHKILGDTLLVQGKSDQALAALDRALALKPDWVEALNSRISALKVIGALAEAVATCKRSLAILPTDTAARNLALTLTYDPDCDDDTLWQAQRAWAKAVTPAQPPAPNTNSPDPERRLRVAYLSADFRNHPVARNVIGLLTHHDRSQVEVVAYPLGAAADETSRAMEQAVDRWRPLRGLSDAGMAQAIRDDGIDVLVIVAGWTGANRPSVAALRPAPVQVSYYDVGSSGLDSMDGWLTDPWLHPEGTTERFTERLIRIPSLYLHPPLDEAPPVNALPAGTDGPVTFCSFNNPVKINERVFDLWAGALASVPDSRLLLKYQGVFAEPAMQARYREALALRGVAPERVRFATEKLPRGGHLALYHQADIALDTYPFNGSTTTYEALVMGVPVISLAGGRFVARCGLSLLGQVGLDSLVARRDEDFAALAAALAADRAELAALRAGLRARVLASALHDGSAYARAVEAGYRELWREWCGRQKG